MKRVIRTLLAGFICLALGGCTEDVPEVECSWLLPEVSTDRVPSRSGFNLRFQVRGSFTAEELPAVRFFSDVEVDNPNYPDGMLLESGIAIDASNGCANGCAAGGRLETPITPGVHQLTAMALTPRGNTACEATITVTANSPPVVTGVTLVPANPTTSDDVEFIAEVTDADGDSYQVANSWTGTDGSNPLLGLFLTSLHTEADQVWQLSVSADDGIDRGDSLVTGFTVNNTPPTAPTVAISPQPGRVNSALVCAVTDLDDLDPDSGQDLTTSWSWLRDGIDSGISSSQVEAAATGAGEVWLCSAVINDGSDDSEPGMATTTILGDLSATSPTALSSLPLIAGTLPEQFIGDVGQVGSPGDINGDGLADLVLTANSALCETVFPFACNGQAHAYLFAGDAAVTPSNVGDHSTDFQPPTGVQILAPARIGDLNGDGIDDLVMPYRSARWTQSSGTSGVYLVFGTADGFAAVVDLEADGIKIAATSESAGTLLGQTPCPVGDLDSDGFDDLAITAPGHNDSRGSLFVIYGHPGAWVSGFSPGSLHPGFQLRGGPENLLAGELGNGLGQACAGPIDLNADGRDDLVVSALRGGVSGNGWVLVFFGDGQRWNIEITSSMADIIISGEAIDSPEPTFLTTNFGQALAALGDHDGDGVDDLAISGLGPLHYRERDSNDGDDDDSASGDDDDSASGDDDDSASASYVEEDAGSVWIASGGAAGMVGSVSASDLAYSIAGEGNIGFCGHPAGVDLNGDGLGDLACGDSRADDAADFEVAATPSVRVFTGSLGSIEATRSYSSADLIFTAAADDHRIGASVTCLEDYDGDYFDELLIGSPGIDAPLSASGGVYLVDLNP